MSTLQGIRTVLGELEHEAVTHLNEWGGEHPRDGTGGEDSERGAIVFRKACVDAFAAGRGTWRALAMDRLMVAFAETGPEELRDTLLDAAGLLVAWVVDLEVRHKDVERDAPGTESKPSPNARAG